MTEPPGSSVAHSQGTATNANTETRLPITFTADELSLFRQGLPEDADQPQREAFAWYSVRLYKSKSWCNDTLSEYYADDFKSFSEDHFAELSASTRRELRDVLRRQGVYVKKGRNVSIATALHEVVKDEIPWPDDDPDAPSNRISSTISPSDGYTSNRGNTGGNFSNFKFVSNISKAYTRDEERFSGKDSDNFERKLKLFNERCTQNGVADADKPKAFSIMLTERALQYYFDHLQGKRLNFDNLCDAIRRRFLTEEHTRGLLREWESITLEAVMSENSGKKATECLDILIARLEDIQSGLTKDYQKEVFLKNKLLNAVKDINACKLAYYKPAEDLEGVIADLHSSLAAVPQAVTPVLDANFVDRKFRGDRRGRSSGSGVNARTCFVCKRKGCWSTNHTNEERLAALRKSKSFRQFLTIVFNDNDEDDCDPETELTDQLEEIAAHVIDLGNDDGSSSGAGPSSNIARIESDDNSASFLASLLDSITAHSLTARVYDRKQYSADKFFGILIDTGCSRSSSGGLDQYRAYCQHIGIDENIDRSKTAVCKFGISSSQSVGVADVEFPISNIVLKFSMHIIDTDLPILLSLADMDRLQVHYNNLEDKLYHVPSGHIAKVSRKFDHPFIWWNPIYQCLFSEVELRRLHKRFGHPHADKLYNLLKRSELPDVDSKTREILEDISRKCLHCQRYAQAPRRFKFNLREDKDFNHTVFVDIFYIDKRPILHVVDESTRYQAARWLPTVSADAVWRALRMCWIDVYLGPPDVITHDAGKQFMARVFQSNSEMLRIQTKGVPIESPNSMSFVERYHVPVRRAYNIINAEAPDTDPEQALQMAVKSVNDSAGPDGLVPTLLVYGALPRLGLPSDPPTPSSFKRAVAVRKATQEISKHFARRQVSAAVRTRNGPDTSDIHSAPIDSHVLVYRPEKDIWEGPYTLLDMQGETCTVLLPPPSGPSNFRSTVVKRFIPDEHPQNTEEDQQASNTNTLAAMIFTIHSENDSEDSTPTYVSCLTSIPRNSINSPNICSSGGKNSTILFSDGIISTKPPVVLSSSRIPQSSDDRKYAASRQKEIDGLFERGVFSISDKSKAEGLRIYGSRFVDHVKNEGTPSAFEKSRLVVQGFNDWHCFLTYAPTVQRASQRLLLSIAVCDKSLAVISRDVSQAYVQSETTLQRPVFVKPPTILKFPDDVLFKVNRPLYGLPEAGNHWFHTYHRYHTQDLQLRPSIYDPCLLYTKGFMAIRPGKESTARGLACIQTDDTVYVGNAKFFEIENKLKERFDSKEIEVLSHNHEIKFNGAIVRQQGNAITISQAKHIEKMNLLDPSHFTKEQFVTERARGAYIAAVCRPDCSYAFSKLSQATEPDEKDVKDLNNAIKACKDYHKSGLRFVPLDTSTIELSVFIDAGFATNKDLSSQLGYVIILMDGKRNSNIVHYGSIKSRRVTRSVLAAELFAMTHGFDVASTIRLTVNDVFGRVIPMKFYTDSKSLFDCLTNINSTAEKRLLIDLRMLRQCYERREITEVFWIPTSQNPSDAFTKLSSCSALRTIMETNSIELTPNAWVERNAKSPPEPDRKDNQQCSR